MAVNINTVTGLTQVLERSDFATTGFICNAGGKLEPTIQKGTSLAGNGSTANPLVVKLSTDAGNDIVFGTDGGVKLDVSVLNHTVTGVWQFLNPVAFGTSTPADRPIVVDTAGNTLTAGASSILVQGSANKERIEARSVFNGGAIFQVSGSRGTIAAPLYNQINDQLGFFQYRGYDEATVQYVSLTQMVSVATENHTASAKGTDWRVSTTTTGTTASNTRIQAGSAGIFNQVGGSTSLAQDGGTVQASSGGLVGNTAGGADTTITPYTLPINAFVKTGDRIETEILGYFNATAGVNKQVRLFFAGFNLVASFVQGATGVILPFKIKATINRYAASNAYIHAEITVGAVTSSQRTNLAGVSWAIANTMPIIVNGPALNDTVVESCTVDFYRAP